MDWLEWLENSEDSSLISSCRLWTRREARCLYSWCIADSSSLISGTCKNTTHSVTPNSSVAYLVEGSTLFPDFWKYSLWTEQSWTPNGTQTAIQFYDVWEISLLLIHIYSYNVQCLVIGVKVWLGNLTLQY